MVTLDTTVSGADSNSYGTLVEASTYYADGNIPFSTVWLALATDDIRNSKLIAATRAIERMKFISEKYDTTIPQALQFPVIDQYPYDFDEIPPDVLQAQFEMVIVLNYDQDATTSQSTASRDIKAVDVFQTVKVQYDDFRSNEQNALKQSTGGSIDAVNALLCRWLAGTGAANLDWVR